MNKGKIIILIPILLLGTIFAPAIIRPTHAAVTGEICLNDPTTANGSTTPCPATPAIFDGPKAQQIRVGVYVQGSDALSGFDIILLANHTVVTPVGVDLTGTILPGTPTVILECLQGLLKAGSVCGSQDNVDALHFTVTAGLGLITVPPTTGLLFTAVYNITGTAVAAGTPIGYQTGCTSTSVTGGVCVTIANGSTTPDSETAQAGRFNNSAPPPSVIVTATPSSFGPEFPGTSNTATITASAGSGYPGFATDSVTFTTVASPGLTATLTGTNPCATGGTSCSVSLSLTATASGNYFVTVYGTYATVDSLNNPDTLVSAVNIHVVANDFSFTINPTSISFAAGSTATSTITLTSLNDFAGSIILSSGTIIPATPPLTITYNPTIVTVAAGATGTSTATFSASPTTATTYHAQVKAASGTRVKISPTLTIQVATAATPDFALRASPTSLSILPGATGTSTLTVAPLNGFTGTVNLATTVSPATGPTVSLSPASIAAGFGNSTLTISSQSSTPTGTYNVTITGTSGTLTHVIAVTVVVSGSGVGVVCIVAFGTTSCPSIPATLTGTQGTQLRVSIFIQGSNALNGFDITLQADHNVLRPVGVDLNGTVLPTPTTVVSECIGGIIVHGNSCPGNIDSLELAAVGAVAQITFPPTTGLLFTAIYNVTGTTSGIPLGYRTGCSGGSVSGTTTCVTISNGSIKPVAETVQTAVVTTSTSPDFVLSANPSAIVVNAGSSGTSSLSVTSINGFSGTVSLNTTVVSGNLVVSLSPASVSLGPGQTATSTVTISAPTSTVTGAYLASVAGISGTLFHTFGISVTLNGSPTPDFTISTTPGILSIVQGSSATSTATLTSLNGLSGAVSLTASSSPAGLTATLSVTSVTLTAGGTATSTLTVSTTTSTLTGSYIVTLTGLSGSTSHSMTLQVTVAPLPQPDFILGVNPAFVTVPAGANASSLISLTSLNGFSGYVNLTATMLTTSGISLPVPHLIPSIVFLSAGGTQTSVLLLTTSTTTSGQTYTVSVVGTATAGSTFVFHRILVQLQVVRPPDTPPVANFSFSPTNPVVGQFVNFDGSASFDPDGNVVFWSWSFGDLGFGSSGQITSHVYNNPGNYTVTLTVTDNAGFSASRSSTVNVRSQPAHDVSILQVDIRQRVAVSTQTVFINVQLTNTGLNNENVSLTAYANGRPVQTLRGLFLPSCVPSPINFCGYRNYFTIAWDTSGTTPGNYTISVTVFLAPGEVDPTPADNTMSGGTVTILPPPVITLSPNTGPDGTKVTIQGTGFPVLEQFGYGYQPVVYVEINFDNMSTGFTLARNGTFTFTFDVPLSQAGPHGIFAYDPNSGAHASAIITVTPTSNSNLAISIDMGTIYFPGDTATAYILTTFNGAPVGSQNTQLQVTLFKPDGTNVTLTATRMGTGLYKVTYPIPNTGPLGTYLILAKAQQTGPLDASALVSFEVKLNWLSSNNGKITVGATTLAGVVGLVGLTWKKGYLRRKKDDEPPTFPF